MKIKILLFLIMFMCFIATSSYAKSKISEIGCVTGQYYYIKYENSQTIIKISGQAYNLFLKAFATKRLVTYSNGQWSIHSN